MFLAGRKKTVESKSILANVGVNEERDFGVELAERGVGGERNGDDVTDTTDIHENLIGAFVSEPAAKLSDHRRKVLPLFVRPSTFEWDSGYRSEKGRTACALFTVSTCSVSPFTEDL